MDTVTTKCFCPETPHDRDEFTLADGEHLSIDAGLAAAVALSVAGTDATVTDIIGPLLRHGAITSWNLVDGEGNKVPINPQTVGERLTWLKGGLELANAAIERYVTGKGAPFGSGSSPKKNVKSLSGGQTARSTSAKTPSSSQLQELSA